MKLGVLLAGIFLVATQAQAKVKTQLVEYKDGDQVLQGFLAYDDAKTGKRPGVLVIHEWKGLNEYAESRAKQLAQLGYVAFAADIYGKGVRPTSNEEAGKIAGSFKKNIPLLRTRVNLGLDQLKSFKQTDSSKLAAIGYCFGGTTVLELARSGAKLNGVVSFHGGLSTPNPAEAGSIHSKVLVLHGADDPNVKPDEVQAFEEEMKKSKTDWQLVAYGGAVHGFTNPSNGSDNSKGVAYNAEADKRSWKAMKDFFGEIF